MTLGFCKSWFLYPTLKRTLRRKLFGKSNLVQIYKDARGRKRFKGNVRRLKDSQAYPLRFGKEALRLHLIAGSILLFCVCEGLSLSLELPPIPIFGFKTCGDPICALLPSKLSVRGVLAVLANRMGLGFFILDRA